MPGFFVSNRMLDMELYNCFTERCIRGKLEGVRGTVCRHTLSQFLADKAMEASAEYVVVLEGALLNRAELCRRYLADSVTELLWRMYERCGDTFFSELRGECSGALYDVRQDKWLVFTSHSGAKPVFYARCPNGFFAGSEVGYVLEACRRSDVPLHMNESAAWQMLTYGFMIDDSTYAAEIRRLRGGTFLRFQNGRAEIGGYHTFQKHPNRFEGCGAGEIVKELDTLFRRAVAREYEKDHEYGREHIADISGGLDTRMSLWVAHTLGYGPIQLKTYGRGGCLDERISRQIARHLQDPILIYPLDDASFLYDIEENVRLCAGLSFYSGITGGSRLLKTLDTGRYGMEHTGIFGGAVLSSWYRSMTDQRRRMPSGAFSRSGYPAPLAEAVEKMEAALGDHEMFLWYTRGFQGAANTFLIRQNYLEPVSAYMDVDFVQLCMDIPLELRMHHRIHKKWILDCYPEAARFMWEKTHGKITEGVLMCGAKHLLFHGIPRGIRMVCGDGSIACGMNPMDYWLAHDINLRAALDDYACRGLRDAPVSLSESLADAIRNTYRQGNAVERSMALSVLAALKLYFGGGWAQ